MKASLSFETGNPEKLEEAVGLSLRSSGKVRYSYDTDDSDFKVDVETESLGSLRGATDSVFRLVSLSERLR